MPHPIETYHLRVETQVKYIAPADRALISGYHFTANTIGSFIIFVIHNRARFAESAVHTLVQANDVIFGCHGIGILL